MNLIIRKMCENDLHPLYELLSNPKVMAYLEPPYSLSQTESFLRAAGLPECPLVYAVTENGRFIGYVIYHESELTDMLIEKAQRDKKNLVIECVPEQVKTRHVALKKGFEYIGNYDGLDVFIRRMTI